MAHIYRVVVEATYDQQKINNVLWLKHPSDVDGSKALDIATDVVSKFTSGMRGIFSSSLTFIHVDAICMTMPEGQGSSFRQNFGSGSSGILAGPRQVPQVAICWTLKTGLVQPQGHLFWSGVTNNDLSGGALNDTGFNRHVTASNNLIGFWGVNSSPTAFKWGVWSKKLAGPIRPHSMAAWFPVTGVFINKRVTTMNTRRVGVGL